MSRGWLTFTRRDAKLLVGFLLFCILAEVGILVMNSATKPPEELGLQDGKLAACPASPNCVSTQATDSEHRMEPIEFEGDADRAWEKLVDLIGQTPRARIVHRLDDYLHVEFRTLLLRFVDDVEFALDRQTREIHFRSASRIGYSDMGTNRRRMERLSQELAERLSESP